MVGERQRWFQEFESAKLALSSPKLALELNLPCIGTVLVQVLEGRNLPSHVKETFCRLVLNNQNVPLLPAPGSTPNWNQAAVLCMASLDDYLRLSLYSYRRYSPDELVGQAELSLQFLEYYNERTTQDIQLQLDNAPFNSKVSIRLQYRPL